ncbi:MAG: GNAT family acetyltransferase [Phycisphaeraceae bacterium]|nr:GNAT family acetyltransferase [Phycisphaeraceae bacterium]
MIDLHIRPYQASDQAAVVTLWERCDLLRPWNDPKRDIAIKTGHSPELLWVGIWQGQLVATVMVGFEGHRGWINYLAVEPAVQRQGLGRRMMREAEDRLRALGCPKINLQVRTTNQGVVAFYEAIGFRADDVVSLGKRLS